MSPVSTARPAASRPRVAPSSRPVPRSPKRAAKRSGREVATRRALLTRRARGMRIALVLALVVVAARLVEVQVLRAGQYARAAAQELTVPVTIPALRGSVIDRKGVVLMTSVPTDMVVADDFQVQHPRQEARALAPLVHRSAASLTRALTERSGYVPLVRHLPADQAKKVTALAFPGITMVGDAVTVAPDGTLATPVVGGVNAAGKGDAGLEAQYNQLLAGRPGHETLLESPAGVPLPSSPVAHVTGSVSGTGLQLTLDAPLQYVAEQDLAKELVASHARSGEAVVMDVRTGQVLAMANLVSTTPPSSATGAAPATTAPTGSGPTGGGPVPIGPNGPVQEAPSNYAMTQLYEPGSVFKIVAFSAALADGVVTPSTVFTVPDRRVIDGDVFHDAEPHPTQRMTATQILAQSSNIGTSEIAQKLGETRLLAQVKQLGFGTTTGLHFPGASPGLLATSADWSATDFVSLAIGQTDAVSAMQVLEAYSALADGGVRVAPKLVKARIGAEGTLTPTPRSTHRRVVPAHVAHELTGMLEQVVDNGTGGAPSVPGYLVAGKTGTSQIPGGPTGYLPGAFDATFVGYAPANHPVLSAIVMLNRPTPIYGGAVAAPVFSQIMTYALHRYDVPTSPGLDGKPQAQVPLTAARLVQDAT